MFQNSNQMTPYHQNVNQLCKHQKELFLNLILQQTGVLMWQNPFILVLVKRCLELLETSFVIDIFAITLPNI